MLNKVPINSFAKVSSGQGAPQKDSDFSNEGYPFIRAGSLDGLLSGSDELSLPRINLEIAKRYKLKLFQPNTIIFAKSGMSALKGRIYKIKTPCYLVNHLATLNLSENVSPDYILYALRYFSPVRLIINSAYPSLNLSAIESFEIPLPNLLDDQKRIARILSECETLIQTRKKSINLLDELLESTFLKMFSEEFKKSSEWKTKLIDVAPSIDSGWSPVCENFPRKYDDEWAVLKLSCVTGKNFDPSKNKALLPNTVIKKAIIPQKGDLLFSRKNTSELVGATAYVFANYQNIILPDTIFRINYISQKVNGIFLWYLLNNKNFSRRVRDLANGAAGSMPNISQSKLLNLLIPNPPMVLQNEFSDLVDKTLAIKTQFNVSLKELENLYASISQRAFNGELDLSKVDISDMEESKKSDLELVTDIGVEEKAESIKRKAELVEIVDQRREDDSYLSKNCRLYIENSKDLRSKIYLLSKKGEINVLDFKDELIELDKIGEQLHFEVGKYTPWQIDRHKSVERYLPLLPSDLTDDYVNLNVFSRHLFDYSSMTLDDFYGIPDDIVAEYGSIESSIMDLEFFLKKYFSKRLFSFEEVESLYNKLVYDRGDWFKYDEIKEFIFKSLETDDALLAQSFEEIEIKGNETEKSKIIKRIMLKVYS